MELEICSGRRSNVLVATSSKEALNPSLKGTKSGIHWWDTIRKNDENKKLVFKVQNLDENAVSPWNRGTTHTCLVPTESPLKGLSYDMNIDAWRDRMAYEKCNRFFTDTLIYLGKCLEEKRIWKIVHLRDFPKVWH